MAPKLSICICTYNRAERARAQVAYILPVITELGGTVELLVSNNASTDETAAMLEPFSAEHFRVINRRDHYPTGEEHAYAAIHDCCGDFIWFLGDDDIPNLSTVRQLPHILGAGGDFFAFNSLYADGNGGLIGRFLKMNAEQVEGEFASAATALGFISTLPGMSNAIYRRAMAAQTDWRDITAVSPLYSHVIWWFRAFKGMRFVLINKPLVRYRVETSISLRVHFDKVTDKLGVGKLFPWCLGLVRLLDMMEREGSISADDIRNIWEFERDGTVFRLLDNLVHVLHEQLKECVLSESELNLFGLEEFRFCRDWLLKMDAEYYSCLKTLEHAFEARYLPPEDAATRISWVHDDFWMLLRHKQSTSNPFINHIETFGGFDIYAHRFRTVAFKIDNPIDRQATLRWIDPDPVDGIVIVAADIQGVKDQVTIWRDRGGELGPL